LATPQQRPDHDGLMIGDSPSSRSRATRRRARRGH